MEKQEIQKLVQRSFIDKCHKRSSKRIETTTNFEFESEDEILKNSLHVYNDKLNKNILVSNKKGPIFQAPGFFLLPGNSKARFNFVVYGPMTKITLVP